VTGHGPIKDASKAIRPIIAGGRATHNSRHWQQHRQSLLLSRGPPHPGGEREGNLHQYSAANNTCNNILLSTAMRIKASKMIPKAALIRMIERKIFNDEGYLGLCKFRLYLLSIYVEKKYGFSWNSCCGWCCCGFDTTTTTPSASSSSSS
jgi:hypothetical protein